MSAEGRAARRRAAGALLFANSASALHAVRHIVCNVCDGDTSAKEPESRHRWRRRRRRFVGAPSAPDGAGSLLFVRRPSFLSRLN